MTPAHLDLSSLIYYLMVLSIIAWVGHAQGSLLMAYPLLDLVGVSTVKIEFIFTSMYEYY